MRVQPWMDYYLAPHRADAITSVRRHQCDGISSMALLACVSVQVGTALIPLASVLASAGTALM